MLSLEASGARLPNPDELRKISIQGLNRTIDRARTLVGRKTVETYNLSTRQIAPYITARRVSQSATQLEGSVDLHLRAIGIETFRPRVVLRSFTYLINGREVTRRLPTIELQRFRNGSPKLVKPAFPLHQRRTGQLRAGDTVRKRTGTARDKLTPIRYYTFPRRFIDETLAPAVREFAGPRLAIELDAAFRAFSSRGRRELKRRVGRGVSI